MKEKLNTKSTNSLMNAEFLTCFCIGDHPVKGAKLDDGLLLKHPQEVLVHSEGLMMVA